MQDKLSRPHRYTSHRAKSPCNEPHMSLTRGMRGIGRHLAQFEQEVLKTENVRFLYIPTHTPIAMQMYMKSPYPAFRETSRRSKRDAPQKWGIKQCKQIRPDY